MFIVTKKRMKINLKNVLTWRIAFGIINLVAEKDKKGIGH